MRPFSSSIAHSPAWDCRSLQPRAQLHPDTQRAGTRSLAGENFHMIMRIAFLSLLAICTFVFFHHDSTGAVLAMAVAAANPAMQNIQARNNLIASGLAFTKRLQSYSSLGSAAALGATVRIPLDRTGIVTGVTLLFTVPFTANGAAQALVQSTYMTQYHPYNIVQNITYTDFAGVKHINTSGFMLHALNMLRAGRTINNSRAVQGYITSETGINSNILGTMNAATGAAVLKGSNFPHYGCFFFSLYVPLAYD